jgi:hypothetical protein
MVITAQAYDVTRFEGRTAADPAIIEKDSIRGTEILDVYKFIIGRYCEMAARGWNGQDHFVIL